MFGTQKTVCCSLQFVMHVKTKVSQSLNINANHAIVFILCWYSRLNEVNVSLSYDNFFAIKLARHKAIVTESPSNESEYLPHNSELD